jgi:hypothetical protein
MASRVFIIYKPFLLPDPNYTARTWRKVAAEHGLELYLCHMVFGTATHYNDFDAVVDFEPFGVRRIPTIYKRPFSYMKRVQYMLQDTWRAIIGTKGFISV